MMYNVVSLCFGGGTAAYIQKSWRMQTYMRLRNIPGAKDAILESPFVIQEPEKNKGKWSSVFPDEQPDLRLVVHYENSVHTASLPFSLPLCFSVYTQNVKML